MFRGQILFFYCIARKPAVSHKSCGSPRVSLVTGTQALGNNINLAGIAAGGYSFRFPMFLLGRHGYVQFGEPEERGSLEETGSGGRDDSESDGPLG